MREILLLREWLLNVGWVALLAIVTIIYYRHVAPIIPSRSALTVNFIIFPVAVGLLGYFLLSGSFVAKTVFICIIPVSHVIYFGGDPGKPGLEIVLAYVEAAFILIGMALGLILSRTIVRSL